MSGAQPPRLIARGQLRRPTAWPRARAERSAGQRGCGPRGQRRRSARARAGRVCAPPQQPNATGTPATAPGGAPLREEEDHVLNLRHVTLRSLFAARGMVSFPLTRPRFGNKGRRDHDGSVRSTLVSSSFSSPTSPCVGRSCAPPRTSATGAIFPLPSS